MSFHTGHAAVDLALRERSAAGRGRNCIMTLGGVARWGSGVMARLSIATRGLGHADVLMRLEGMPEDPELDQIRPSVTISRRAEMPAMEEIQCGFTGGGGIDGDDLGAFTYTLYAELPSVEDLEVLALRVTWGQLEHGRLELPIPVNDFRAAQTLSI